MAAEADLLNIVVLGFMNPRIHHPAWYQLVGLLNEKEVDEAMKSADTFSVGPIAQFKTGDFLVACQEERWQIQTTKPECTERMRNIVGRLFDEILPHTPVSKFGFNFDYHRITKAESVAQYLAECVTRTPLKLNGDRAATAELKLRRELDDYTAVVVVQPHSDKSFVSVHNNYDYTVKTDAALFKLADLIAKYYSGNQVDAETQTALIVQAINESMKG